MNSQSAKARQTSAHWSRLATGLLLSGCLLGLSGCVIAGAAAYALVGEVPVDAKYKLPHATTLVFVENYSNPDATSDDSDVLCRYIVQNLKKHLDSKKTDGKVPVPFIDPMRIYDLRTADSVAFHKMKIQEVGRKLGAKQIIYVSLESLGVQMMGSDQMMNGVASARVKVVGAGKGQTLWPLDSSGGYPIGYRSKLITPQQDVSYQEARDQTLQIVAKNISRLFYKWKPSEQDTDNNMNDVPD